MACIVELENSQGRRFLVNPEHVASLYEANRQVDQTIIALIDGRQYSAKQNLKEVRDKLRLS